MESHDRILLVQLADIGDLALATPAMAALREAKPEATIDLLASRHASAIIPPGLIDAVMPIDKGRQNATRALLSPGNLARLRHLRRQAYDTVIFFHHFSLRAGLLKFRLIAQVAGARRVIGLQNEHARFLTDSVVDQGFGHKHEAQYWLELAALAGASAAPAPPGYIARLANRSRRKSPNPALDPSSSCTRAAAATAKRAAGRPSASPS